MDDPSLAQLESEVRHTEQAARLASRQPDAEARHARAEQMSAGARHKKQPVSPRARLRETGLAQRAATTRQAEPKLKARA